MQILDEAIEAAVRLSHRYIPARQLPDKSVSLLDTAAARVAISQHAVPPALDDCRRRIERLEIEQAIIGREIAVGIDADARAARVADALVHEHAALAELEARWEDGTAAGRQDLVRCADACARRALPSDPDSRMNLPATMWRCSTNCANCNLELATRQGDSPLILPSVDEQAVAAVVSDWTGIPVRRMVRDEAHSV